MKDGFIDLGMKHECCGGEDKYYPRLDVKGIPVDQLKGEVDEYIEAKVILKKKSYEFEDMECCFEVCGIKFDKMKVKETDMRKDAEDSFDQALEEQY